MLLMKLGESAERLSIGMAWTGSNGDEASLLNASNKIVSATQTYGLQVGVCLEDRFATSTSEVTANINYLENNYYTQSNYIRVGANNNPLTLLFGPITYQQPSQWTTILSGVQGQTPAIVPLQYQASQVGSARRRGIWHGCIRIRGHRTICPCSRISSPTRRQSSVPPLAWRIRGTTISTPPAVIHPRRWFRHPGK